jgi:dolichyl-phosphate-mannose-protein mannosyltransferase
VATHGRSFAIVLIVVSAAALALRAPAIVEPLGIDQSLWASAVRAMDRGARLYRDVWEQRPPGIYWIYLTGFRVFGWTPATVVWLDLLASAVTATALFGIARSLSGPVTGGVATLLYAVLTMPAWLYGYDGFLERSVSETFIVACVALAFWCAVAARSAQGAAACAGLLAGAAAVLKPNAGLYLIAALVWIFLYRVSRWQHGAVRVVLVATSFASVAPVMALLWLWWHGVLADARVAVVDFNRFYVSEGFTPAKYVSDFAHAVWLRMKTDPLWLAGAVGAVVAVRDLAARRRLPPLAGLAVIWGAAAVLVIVVNGARLFNSYFIQALAPLAVLSAWLLFETARESRVRGAAAALTSAAMVVLMLQRGYAGRVLEWVRIDVDVLRGRAERGVFLERFGGYANNRGYSARANAELAEYIHAHTSPDDRIFLFGINGAGVYFDADRLPAHRFIRVNFFVATKFPDPEFRLDAVVRELIAVRPRYLVFERLHVSADPVMARTVDGLADNPAVQPLLAGYERETTIEDFTLYRRRD